MNYSIINYKLNSDSTLPGNRIYAVLNEDELNAESEKELKEHNMPIENAALLMQKIWGDQFLSDSLH